MVATWQTSWGVADFEVAQAVLSGWYFSQARLLNWWRKAAMHPVPDILHEFSRLVISTLQSSASEPIGHAALQPVELPPAEQICCISGRCR